METPENHKILDIQKEDQISKTRTIYDAGYGEIFTRNFIAGISRTLGSIFIYIVFLFLVSYVFMQLILPKFLPLINNFINVTDSLKMLNQIRPPDKVIF